MWLFLDILLTIVHLGIIGFNLFGWIPKATRRLHFISVLLTAGSWLILGLWYGIGYCPVTDWQWRVKDKRGERNLPNNFIEYFAEQISGIDLNAAVVNSVVAVVFVLVALLSIYLNFILPLILKRRPGR